MTSPLTPDTIVVEPVTNPDGTFTFSMVTPSGWDGTGILTGHFNTTALPGKVLVRPFAVTVTEQSDTPATVELS